MRVCYNRNSFLFLEPLLTFASFFGIFPKYDFNKKKIVVSTLRSVLVFVAVIAIVVEVIFALSGRARLLYPVFNSKIMIFLDIFSDVVTTFWFVAACFDACTNHKVWGHFFKQIDDIEAHKLMVADVTIENRFYRNPFVQFCLCNIFSLSGLIGIWFVWSHNGPSFNPKYLWIQLILSYIETIAALVTSNVILMIYNKYQQLVKILNLNAQINGKLLENIRTTKVLYCLMDEIMDSFNRLFGKHVLFISLIVACHTLVSLVRIVHSLVGTMYAMSFGLDFAAKNAFSLSIALVSKYIMYEYKLK